MKPPRSLLWLRPALCALTSLREVSLAATALRPLSLPRGPWKGPFVARGALAFLGAARREA
jgi:hypothetical protein